MSEIKFKVRYSALLLKDFTAADMIRVTGLNPESVRTELQRMRQEKLLISTPHPVKQTKRGGRPSIYHLTDDPEKLLKLSKGVEAFYPPLSLTDKPSSRYYNSAKQLIDQALVSDGSNNNDELLSGAKSDLEMAEQAEGGALATEVIKAYLEYERARLMYLSGKQAQALEVFKHLHEFFESNQIDSMVERINEFILCLKASISFARGKPGRYGKAEWAKCLLDTLKDEEFRTDSPLVILLLDLLRKFSLGRDKELITSVLQEMIETLAGTEEVDVIRSENIYRSIENSHLIGFFTELGLSSRNEEAPIPVGDIWPQSHRDEDI